MLPLSSILAVTPARTKQRARAQCFGKADVPKKRKATEAGGYIVETETGKYREFNYQVKCSEGWRRTVVRFHGAVSPKTKVWCWCSCPYFKYNCEVALAYYKSSMVRQSNGQRPRFTNPDLEPRVCKHVYLVFLLASRADARAEHAAKKVKMSDKAKAKREKMAEAAKQKREEQKARREERQFQREQLQMEREEKRAQTKAAVEEKRAAMKQKEPTNRWAGDAKKPAD